MIARVKIAAQLSEHHNGELHQPSVAVKAERMVGEELARRKYEPDKLELAARSRRETTLTVKAIAARVHLGSSQATVIST